MSADKGLANASITSEAPARLWHRAPSNLSH
jgi:hypothetical protein